VTASRILGEYRPDDYRDEAWYRNHEKTNPFSDEYQQTEGFNAGDEYSDYNPFYEFLFANGSVLGCVADIWIVISMVYCVVHFFDYFKSGCFAIHPDAVGLSDLHSRRRFLYIFCASYVYFFWGYFTGRDVSLFLYHLLSWLPSDDLKEMLGYDTQQISRLFLKFYEYSLWFQVWNHVTLGSFERYIWPVLATHIFRLCSYVHDDSLRNFFRKIEIEPHRDLRGSAHSHPQAASDRQRATEAIYRVIDNAGYTPYEISRSSAARRRDIAGEDLPFDLKSNAFDNRTTLPTARSVYVMVDVDYYLDINRYIERAVPIIMYTFQPDEVSGVIRDGMFSTTLDNYIETRIVGGATYRHQIWNYEVDHIVVHYWWGSVTSRVEQICCPGQPHRRWVGIFPRYTTYGWISFFLFASRHIVRRVFNFGNFVTTRAMRMDGNQLVEFISVSKPGLKFCATLPFPLAYTVLGKIKKAKAEGVLANLHSFLMNCVKKNRTPDWAKAFDAESTVQVLAEAMTEIPELFGHSPFVLSLPQCNPHYYCVDDKVDFDIPTETMRLVFQGVQPFTNTAGVPMKHPANDRACIRGRVIQPRSFVKHVPIAYEVAADKFIGFLIADKIAYPVDFDEVSRRQPRPTQQSKIRYALDWFWSWFDETMVVKAFQKREVYGKVTHPRNISQLPSDIKMRYSAFIYGLTDCIMYDVPWYACCKTPRQIATMISEVCLNKLWAIPTDFSKFDGTHSPWLSKIEEKILRRVFPVEYHDEVIKLYRSQREAVGITTFGERYNTGHSRLSGSPETSVFNTIDNALVAFITLSEMKAGPNRYQDAWNGLGAYLGDDGVTAEVDQQLYETVATKVGVKLTACRVEPGEAVPFLSRLFEDPWNGFLGSHMEVRRQVDKLHLTRSATNVPAAVVLYRKAAGYLMTDPSTPFISAWCIAVLRWCANRNVDGWEEQVKCDASWFSAYDREDQFPPCLDQTMALARIAESFGVDVAVIQELEEKFHNVEQGDDISALFPKCIVPLEERKIEVSAVVGDTLHIVDPAPQTPIQPITPKPAKTPRHKKRNEWVNSALQPDTSSKSSNGSLDIATPIAPVKLADPTVDPIVRFDQAFQREMKANAAKGQGIEF